MLKFLKYYINLGSGSVNNGTREQKVNNKNKVDNKKYNNYFGKLPISSNKRGFINSRNCNLTKKNNKRIAKRNCEFLRKGKPGTVLEINESLFADDIKVLSRPKDSSSNSIVLYNNHNGYGYIYKISPATNSIKNEAEIYKRLNQLIFHKVCPHLFLTFGSGIITLPEEDTAVKKLIKEVVLSDGMQYYCQVNETGPETKLIMPFYMLYSTANGKGIGESEYLQNESKSKNFIRVFYNLLFQYCWVIYIFSIIGFSQGDTHFGNIMLVFNKINIFDNPEDETFTPENIKYRSYTFRKEPTNLESVQKTYYLEDLGIDLYIYDFDKGSFRDNTKEATPELLKFSAILQRLKLYSVPIDDLNTLTALAGKNYEIDIYDFMNYYIPVVMSFVPDMYENLYMLVSDKPETDNNMQKKKIKRPHPNESIMDSIKKRVHGSYSTEPLFKKLSGNTTNTSKKM